MAENEARAARIAELKERHPLLTWGKIADRVGVTERSAHEWRRTGAISPENAEALAEVFGVDFDYIWTGPRPDTPELFVDRRNTPAGPVAVDKLEGELEARITAIEQVVAKNSETLELLLRLVNEARSEQERISERLETSLTEATGQRQEIAAALAIQTNLLNDIQAARDAAHEATQALRDEGQEWANRLSETARRIFEEAEHAAANRESTPDRRATSRSPQD